MASVLTIVLRHDAAVIIRRQRSTSRSLATTTNVHDAINAVVDGCSSCPIWAVLDGPHEFIVSRVALVNELVYGNELILHVA